MNSDLMCKVAFWGPQKSGKTWFLKALGRAITNCDALDPNFLYGISDLRNDDENDSGMFSDFPSNDEIGSAEYFWKIYRRPRKYNPEECVSTHTHYVLFSEINGSSALDLDDSAKIAFRDAHLLIVFLDPTILTESNGDNESLILQSSNKEKFEYENDDEDIDVSSLFRESNTFLDVEPSPPQNSGKNPTKLNKQQYLHYIKNLFDYLRNTNAKPRIAICLTKVDQIRLDLKPGIVIPALFGQEMDALIRKNQSRFDLNIFMISSTGYQSTKSREANFNPSSRLLKVPEEWIPYQVERPVFWHLEKVENQKLSQTTSFFGRFFVNSNKQKYIKYTHLNK